MRFKVIERAAHAPDDDPEVIYLMRDGWDDFGYKTLFEAHYRGKFIGGVKIAFQNMAERTSTIDYIPRDFDRLPAEYYSLWPDAKSCQGAYGVYERTGFSIFEALNDISYDLSLFDRVKNEKACTVSLMRGPGQLRFAVSCAESPMVRLRLLSTASDLPWDQMARAGTSKSTSLLLPRSCRPQMFM